MNVSVDFSVTALLRSVHPVFLRDSGRRLHASRARSDVQRASELTTAVAQSARRVSWLVEKSEHLLEWLLLVMVVC